MGINFLNPADISTKRGGTRTKTAKYGKYAERLESTIPAIKDMIEQSDDGKAIVSNADIAELLGMKDRNTTTIYWGVKYVMWQNGIAVDSGTHKDGVSKLLIFREPNEGEKLPDSLAKYNEDPEDPEEEDPENEDPENEDPENEDPENEDPENEDPDNINIEEEEDEDPENEDPEEQD